MVSHGLRTQVSNDKTFLKLENAMSHIAQFQCAELYLPRVVSGVPLMFLEGIDKYGTVSNTDTR